MLNYPRTIFALSATASILTILAACGSDGNGGKAAPPRRAQDADDETFSLEAGSYYIDRIWDISDGCGRTPTSSTNPITSVAFMVTNSGDGHVTMDRCVYEGTSTAGDILDNKGVLHVSHRGRKEISGNLTSMYDQECKLDLMMTANNQFDAVFTDRKSARNQTEREVFGGGDTCTTSYKVTMSKRN